MVLRITEYGGYASGRIPVGGIAQEPAIQAQAIVTGSSQSTNTLSSATRLVRIEADAGCYVYFGSSVSTVIASSTSASSRIIGNAAAEWRGVNPYMRICTLST